MNEENGHWYTKLGAPMHSIAGKSTTLRDARKLSLLPSVTSVLGVIAKPALNNWLQDQAIMAALTMPKADAEDEETYIKRIKTDSKAQAMAAAQEGSRIHRAIEDSFEGKEIQEKYTQHVEAAHSELKKLFPEICDWVSEKSFGHPLGFGGCCDIHSPSTGIIVDWKTKDGALDDGKKLGWDQNQQLAAYAIGLGVLRCEAMSPAIEFRPGAAIFISRTHPGKVASYVWSADEMAQGWKVFEAALQLHKLLKNYDGSW